MAQLSFSSDSLSGLGAQSSKRQKPLPDVRKCGGLCLVPAGVPPVSSQYLHHLWLRYNVWVLLTLIAVIGGVVAFLNEYSVSWLTKVHQMTINHNKYGKGVQFLLWTLWTVGCVILSCVCVALSNSHAAEGS